jgi:mono/diheme cytochrome c family protein
MRFVYLVFAFALLLVLSVAGFRGATFTKPPLEIFPDMDRQPKYKAQAASAFFADGRTDRPLPPNVVPRGDLRLDDHLYRGQKLDGSWASGFPVPVTHELLARGRDRYTIFCAACHGGVGDGNGITKQYGMVATPTFHDDRLRQMAEGEIYNTVTHGKGQMLGYADKLVPEDRWAVVAYMRALQRAAAGRVEDVPQAHRATLGLK